jgi:hypothetical protein
LELLLQKIDQAGRSRRVLQLRALTVLEQIGTAQARDVLRAWAAGNADAPGTREARAALQRLARQPAGPR